MLYGDFLCKRTSLKGHDDNNENFSARRMYSMLIYIHLDGAFSITSQSTTLKEVVFLFLCLIAHGKYI